MPYQDMCTITGLADLTKTTGRYVNAPTIITEIRYKKWEEIEK